MNKWLLFVFAFSVLSCSLDYSQEELAENIPDDIPDYTLFNYRHIIKQNGYTSIELTGSSAYHYTNKNLILLRDASFTEFESDGSTATTGKAAFIRFHSDTENAELYGGFEMFSYREDARISGEYIYWNSTSKLLDGKEHTYITIEKSDGSRISGQDFHGDTGNSVYTFGKNAQGTFTYE